MKTTSPQDLRVPGIKLVPAGSYLITGLPRIRSAWLSALFSREDFPCYHEAPTERMQPIDERKPFGLLDPGAACLYPNAALSLFKDSMIVIIDRPEKDSRRALEKFAGMKADRWDEIKRRYLYFSVKADAQVVRFVDLARYEVVASVYRKLTGYELSRQRFELFDGLRIEQDIVKRAKAEAA